MTGHLFHSLLAVSMGSVFMGALTYIGNAPNFMVGHCRAARRTDAFLLRLHGMVGDCIGTAVCPAYDDFLRLAALF